MSLPWCTERKVYEVVSAHGDLAQCTLLVKIEDYIGQREKEGHKGAEV